jgi:hypothetical protein
VSGIGLAVFLPSRFSSKQWVSRKVPGKSRVSKVSHSAHSTFKEKSVKKVVGSESDCPPILRVSSRRSGRTPALPYPPPESVHYVTEERQTSLSRPSAQNELGTIIRYPLLESTLFKWRTAIYLYFGWSWFELDMVRFSRTQSRAGHRIDTQRSILI